MPMDSDTKPKLVIRPNALRRKRLEAVMSPEDVASRAGMTAGRIHQLEAGINLGLRPTTAQRLAEALGCDPTEITEVIEEEAS